MYRCLGRQLSLHRPVPRRLSPSRGGRVVRRGPRLPRRVNPRPDPLTVNTCSYCGYGGQVSIPEALGSPGVVGADLVVLVTARPIAPASSALAFAGFCQEDRGTPDDQSPPGTPYSPRRPTLGHINIKPSVRKERAVVTPHTTPMTPIGVMGYYSPFSFCNEMI